MSQEMQAIWSQKRRPYRILSGICDGIAILSFILYFTRHDSTVGAVAYAALLASAVLAIVGQIVYNEHERTWRSSQQVEPERDDWIRLTIGKGNEPPGKGDEP